jgi:hypothetical protein
MCELMMCRGCKYRPLVAQGLEWLKIVVRSPRATVQHQQRLVTLAGAHGLVPHSASAYLDISFSKVAHAGGNPAHARYNLTIS